MLRKRSKKYLLVCGLLVVMGAIVYVAPMGRSGSQTGISCGPRAVTALLQEVSVGSSDISDSVAISEQIKTEFRFWDYIPDRLPLIGGATLPWGIEHALEKMGMSGQVEAGLDTVGPQEVPFIALVLGSKRQWHYVTVFDIGKDTVLTNDGPQPAGEFFNKWKWSYYWRCHLEHSDKEVKKQ